MVGDADHRNDAFSYKWKLQRHGNEFRGQVSNGIQYTVLTAKLIPITFTVNNASPTQVGDYIFLTGNTVELGNWSTTWHGAVGLMLTPNYPNWFIVAGARQGKRYSLSLLRSQRAEQ